MRVLMIGDVVGKPGRRALHNVVGQLRQELAIDLVIANGENAAGGKGLTPDTAQEILRAGVDVITSGNHIWDKSEVIALLEGESPVLRPGNYPPHLPGRGHLVKRGVLVVNMLGRTFIGTFDDPFRAMDKILEEFQGQPKAILLDFHAEATSEKGAMGWYLDGKVTAVMGTHTHVPTADARLLPKGTAFVTDVGMVGPRDSIIGADPDDVLERFFSLGPNRLEVANGHIVQFNSVLLELDEATGKARSISRVDREVVL